MVQMLKRDAMSNKIIINSGNRKFIIYIMLAVLTFAVFWQVHQHDFINIDDDKYVTENNHVRSGITEEGVRWAFSTTFAQYWHPVTWLSLMLDYELFGLHAGGYHVHNLFLHILSTLLLFGLLSRMTGEIWKSAFVAAVFALHPLRVESVAWVAKRRDVLCIFFSILTLCLYVWYTEKPVIRRYLFILFSCILALMSKPMAVTLPLLMILLDYWPLRRFESSRGNWILWQLLEKAAFFILSGVFSIITIYAHHDPLMRNFALHSRLTNAIVSFVMYLEKTFWPDQLTVLQIFSDQLPLGQILYSSSLIMIISVFVLITWKRYPYLLVGWFWYTITILPTLGIVQYGHLALSDHHTYLPSIGISIMLAWGISGLFSGEGIRRVLVPASMAVIGILVVLTWQQSGYWKNSITLSDHALQVNGNNCLAYNARGVAYSERGQHQLALDDFNQAIKLNARYFGAYRNRGTAYVRLGQYQLAIIDYNEAIALNPDYVDAYSNRAFVYINMGNIKSGCKDAQKACEMKDCKTLELAKSQGFCH